jgi:hypothetical protein
MSMVILETLDKIDLMRVWLAHIVLILIVNLAADEIWYLLAAEQDSRSGDSRDVWHHCDNTQ